MSADDLLTPHQQLLRGASDAHVQPDRQRHIGIELEEKQIRDESIFNSSREEVNERAAGEGEGALNTVERLAHSVYIIRNFLTEEQQLETVTHCFQYRDPTSVEVNVSNIYTPLFTFKWPSKNMMLDADEAEPRDPTYFAALTDSATSAFTRIVHANAAHTGGADSLDIPLPDTFSAECLRCVLYPANGYLHAHQDSFMGWVMLLSLGESCEFFYGGWDATSTSYRALRLNSGDVIFMNGQKLPHGVSTLYPGSQPTFWDRATKQGLIPDQWRRLNVQWRCPEGIFNYNAFSQK